MMLTSNRGFAESREDFGPSGVRGGNPHQKRERLRSPPCGKRSRL